MLKHVPSCKLELKITSVNRTQNPPPYAIRPKGLGHNDNIVYLSLDYNTSFVTKWTVYIRKLKCCRGMGMEVCCTLGMIEKQQAVELKKAGLTAYNHNLDTSREYYPNVITTRTYDDRLQTLQHVRDAGINVCSGKWLLLCCF